MSNIIIALFLALGFSGWVYSRLQKKTGGQAKTSLIGTAVSGLAVFLVAWSLLGFIDY